jgi:hypothetical protein
MMAREELIALMAAMLYPRFREHMAAIDAREAAVKEAQALWLLTLKMERETSDKCLDNKAGDAA